MSPSTDPPDMPATPDLCEMPWWVPRARRYGLFAVLGVGCVVAGGLVAAVTALAPSELGAWAAAYLVLVGGVAQIGLAAGQAVCLPRPALRLLATQLVAWNVGNAAVLGGTLLGLTLVLDTGGGLLMVAAALFAHAARTATLPTGSAWPTLWRWLLRGYRLLLVVLVVSIPIGLILARLRA